MAKATLAVMTQNPLRQRVTDALREAIVTHQFQPGDRIREEEIARQMAISRGTVREALRHLEQEGLVVSYPYRGTEVAHLTAEEVREIIFPIRLVLERSAFSRVMPQLEDSDFAALAGIVDEMGTAVRKSDLSRLVDLDIAFHRYIIERAKMPHLEQIWHSITPRVRLFFYRNSSTHATFDELVMEHRELLDALQSGDQKRMLAVLEAHIRVPIAREIT